MLLQMLYVCYAYVGYCNQHGKCNPVALALFRIIITGNDKSWCMMNGKRLETQHIHLVGWYHRYRVPTLFQSGQRGVYPGWNEQGTQNRCWYTHWSGGERTPGQVRQTHIQVAVTQPLTCVATKTRWCWVGANNCSLKPGYLLYYYFYPNSLKIPFKSMGYQ